MVAVSRSGSLVLVVALVLVSVLAGCLGSGAGNDGKTVDAPAQDTVLNPDLSGQELRDEVERTLEVTAESEIGAPTWTVGEYWTYEVAFAWEEETFEFTGVVYDDGGSDYLVSTDSRGAAMFEAIFDLPFLGAFAKGSLDTTSNHEPLPLYRWPLTDDKSWEGTFDRDFDGERESYTFHSAFETLETPEGPLPGFTIHGINETGVVLFSYDYVPALHWANHIFFYSAENPEEFEVHIMVTDHGFNWQGELITFAQELALEKFWAMDPTMQEQDTPVTTELPLETFTIAEGATDIGGLWFAGACDGAIVLQLESPSGNKLDVRKTVAPNPADGVPPVTCEFEFNFLDTPAEVGQWSARIVGVSPFFAGGFLQVFAMTAQTITLGGPAEA